MPPPIDTGWLKLTRSAPAQPGGGARNALVATLGLEAAVAQALDCALQAALPGARVLDYDRVAPHAKGARPARGPDVLVARPGGAGAGERLAAIRRAHPDCRVLALVPADMAEAAVAAIDRLADARLPDGAATDRLRDAVIGLLARRADVPAGGGAPADAAAPAGGGGTGDLLEMLPVATYVLQDERFVYANEATALLLGHGRDALARLRCWEVVDPSVRAAMRERLRGWLGGMPIEPHGITPIVTARGERRWIEVFRRRIDFAGAPGLLVAGLDLSERAAWIEGARREIERFENAPFAPAADRPAPQRPEPGRAPEGALARLTRRQRQVLDLIAQGRSNKQIARDLGITEGTAKLHVFSLMRALDVTNRTMLALAAHALHPRNDR